MPGDRDGTAGKKVKKKRKKVQVRVLFFGSIVSTRTPALSAWPTAFAFAFAAAAAATVLV